MVEPKYNFQDINMVFMFEAQIYLSILQFIEYENTCCNLLPYQYTEIKKVVY